MRPLKILCLAAFLVTTSLQAQVWPFKYRAAYNYLLLAQHHTYGNASPENYSMGLSFGVGTKLASRWHLQVHLLFLNTSLPHPYDTSHWLGLEPRAVVDVNEWRGYYSKRPDWTPFLTAGAGVYASHNKAAFGLPMGAGMRYKSGKKIDLEIAYVTRQLFGQDNAEQGPHRQRLASVYVQGTYIFPKRQGCPIFK